MNLLFGLARSEMPLLCDPAWVSYLATQYMLFINVLLFGALMVILMTLRGHLRVETPEVTIFETADEIAYAESTGGIFVSISPVEL